MRAHFSELQLLLLANNPRTDQVILSRSPLVPGGTSNVCPVKLYVLVHLSLAFAIFDDYLFQALFSCKVETSPNIRVHENYSHTITDLHGTPCHVW